MGSCSFRADAPVKIEQQSPFQSGIKSPINDDRLLDSLQNEVKELRR